LLLNIKNLLSFSELPSRRAAIAAVQERREAKEAKAAAVTQERREAKEAKDVAVAQEIRGKGCCYRSYCSCCLTTN
jgi:hypothetical protein